MNVHKYILVVLMTTTVSMVHGQGSFQNLDFESANLTSVPSGKFGGPVPITSAVPGWSAVYGNTPITQAFQNDFALSAPSVDIIGPNWNNLNPGIIDGNYSVFLQSGTTPNGSTYNTSIFQTGTVPKTAESLDVKESTVWVAPPGDPASSFSVSFNGTTLSPILLSIGQSPSGQSYNLYGFNIAPYAGNTGQLQLTALIPNFVQFDDISFSPNAVPESSAFVLSGIAGLLFAGYRRFAPKR